MDAGSTIHREFDELNRITSYTDYQGRTVKYGYDNLGNLVSLTYPGGEIVTYTHNNDGSIATMTSKSGGTIYTWAYAYDRYGRLEKITRPDGTVENRFYDDAGNLEHQEDINADGTKVQENTYTYNVFGEVIEKQTMQDGDLATLEVVKMTYDDANRLETYNGKAVIYDAKGNMTYGPVDGVMQDLSYDCRNRLVSAGGVTYTYDAENTRIATTENGKTTEYVTDTGGSLSKLLVAYESDGSETSYYYGAEGLAGQYNSKTKEGLFYHFDNIGSTTAVTNVLGIAVAEFVYGTYGELLSTVEKGIRFLYNGAYGVVTDSNGLYYMRARYYNPDIKRFINQDIKVGDIGSSQSLNRYAYCEGNPVSLIDPFGLSPEGAQDSNEINWLSEFTHLVLGFAGAAPGIGFVFDLADAALYLHEKDKVSATVSFLSAIPVAGIFVGIGKIGAKTVKIGGYIADMIRTSNKFRHTADAIVTATSNFRKILHSGATDVMTALIAKGREASKILQKGSEGLTELTGMIKRQGEKIYTSVRRTVQRLKDGKKAISYTDYDNIYQSSIHNAGKDKVMLGKYDGGGATSYITKAGDDYTYFSLGNEWDTIKTKYGYSDDDMFKLFNEAFLDDGINSGKTFQFSHNPINDTGALGQEYKYLLKNNYRWDAATMTMKPRY